MIQYCYSDCPLCKQGRLFVAARDDTNALFLECEECSRAWPTPEAALSNDQSAFLAIEIESHPASLDEIEKAGWLHYRFAPAMK